MFPPELVDRVVDEAGVREQRTRTLPARVVVYYLLAMVLFFQSGYGEVWNKLVAGLDWARRFRVRVSLGMQPSPAAVTLARKRLGWQVMAALLEAVAGPLAGEEQDRALVAGMRLVAVDGMCLDLPDNEENGAEFGYPGNDGGRGPFPQIRVVGLAECGTRAVLGRRPRRWPPGSSRWPGSCCQSSGLVTCCWPTATSCPTGCSPMCLQPGCTCCGARKATSISRCCRYARRHVPVTDRRPGRLAAPAPQGRLGGDIPGIPVRVIEYSVASEDGSEISETFTLVTDILDPALLSPGQADAAYASRWQLETCFNELETSIRGGAAVVLRSKSPPMIRQEIYAMLCCYQAIRTLISHAAGDAGAGPGPHLLYPRPRRDPQPHQRLRMPFPLRPCRDSRRSRLRDHLRPQSRPGRPGRRYERKTKRPGGRYKTRKPGETAQLTPLTRIVFWLMPVPA